MRYPRYNTIDTPVIYWAGIPGNAGDFPSEESFYTFLEQAVCLFAGETITGVRPVRSASGLQTARTGYRCMWMKQYHLDPAECLMTGNDDIADCHGAASAGIASRYVATRQSPKINGPLPENCEKIAAIAELF